MHLTQDELNRIVEINELFITSEGRQGAIADLTNYNLEGADLRGADWSLGS